MAIKSHLAGSIQSMGPRYAETASFPLTRIKSEVVQDT